ncbi:MAG: hypothetical protein PHV07_02850 [Oscillospiraceae bacterium]|nr:hypothetical protein [Oscillospiraceae bacterium]
MRERIVSISSGIAGSLASSGVMGILHDISIACVIALLGGLFGYMGNELAKNLHKKIKARNEKRR